MFVENKDEKSLRQTKTLILVNLNFLPASELRIRFINLIFFTLRNLFIAFPLL